MATTTLLKVATGAQAELQAAQIDAQAKLATAQAALADAQADRTHLSTQLAKLEREIATLRAELATAEMPADVTAASVELEQKIVARRSREADVLAVDELIEKAQRAVDRGKSGLERAAADLGRATAWRATAEAEATERAAWRAAIAALPLSKVGDEAEDALSSTSMDDAKKRVQGPQGDIPTELATRARERTARELNKITAEQDRVETAEAKIGNAAKTTEGLTGDSTNARTAFLRAETAFRDYVLNARERYRRALSLMDAIKAAPPITPAERSRITDTKIVNAGKTAATKEKARDDAAATLDAKRIELEDARLKALATDIDADPATDADVKKAQKAFTDAETAFDTANGQYTDADRADLTAWEATVPDSSWRLLVDLQEAERLLTELKNAKPEELRKGMDDAEEKLGEALGKEAKAARTARFLVSEAGERADRRDAVARLVRTRLMSVARGDDREAA